MRRLRLEGIGLLVLALLAAGVTIVAMLNEQWGLAGTALFIGLLAVIALYLLPRMYGPFEIGGKRFRFRGVLVQPPDSPKQELPPGTALPSAPEPPALPGTTEPSEGSQE
jgi:hypothetical protein